VHELKRNCSQCNNSFYETPDRETTARNENYKIPTEIKNKEREEWLI
jgi:hypothetical protein